jgi:acetyl-CoA acetyltransferase
MVARSTRTAIVGVGHSKVYRRASVSLGVLAIDACTKAIADAGLTPEDVDGVVADPVQPFGGASNIDGLQVVTPEFIITGLGLDVSWYETLPGGTISHTLIAAVNAVSSGQCRAVLAFRALHSPAGRYGVTDPAVALGPAEFDGPYGLYPPANTGQLWSRYMFLYGTTREQMAPFIVNNRRNGLLWEHGYWTQHRPEVLTEADYMNAPMVSSPLSLLDCDIPVQGCGAFLITSAEVAKDMPHKPAYVRGWAVPGKVGGGLWQPLELLQERAAHFAQRLYKNARIGPSDVSAANLYDGFSMFVPLQLEAFGFCKEGEAFDFMTSEKIGIGGELPVNTSGGNLGGGRMHGVSHIMESTLQIMGRSGPRQVKDAQIVVATAGAPPGRASGLVLSATPD